MRAFEQIRYDGGRTITLEETLDRMNSAPHPVPRVTIFAIGFGQKSAREFFELLRVAGVRKVIDVRLNNVSQLAGFTKKDDLAFFLEQIGGIGYEHRPELAPTKQMLDDYRSGTVGWDVHERNLRQLLAERGAENTYDPATADGACLLCSEPAPDRCHRRIVAEYLSGCWGNVEIRHLPLC